MFSYDETRLLGGINLVIPQGTTTPDRPGLPAAAQDDPVQPDRPVLGLQEGQGASSAGDVREIHL